LLTSAPPASHRVSTGTPSRRLERRNHGTQVLLVSETKWSCANFKETNNEEMSARRGGCRGVGARRVRCGPCPRGWGWRWKWRWWWKWRRRRGWRRCGRSRGQFQRRLDRRGPKQQWGRSVGNRIIPIRRHDKRFTTGQRNDKHGSRHPPFRQYQSTWHTLKQVMIACTGATPRLAQPSGSTHVLAVGFDPPDAA
jgi:hypothetical protein